MRLQDALPLVHVPVTASRGRQSRAEASDQRSATGVGRCGLRGGAYLDRRATSSLRCAWRVSSTRSRMLGLRSSFGADMAAVPPASGQWIVRSPRLLLSAAARVGVVVPVATGELRSGDWREMREHSGRRPPTLYKARGVQPLAVAPCLWTRSRRGGGDHRVRVCV